MSEASPAILGVGDRRGQARRHRIPGRKAPTRGGRPARAWVDAKPLGACARSSVRRFARHSIPAIRIPGPGIQRAAQAARAPRRGRQAACCPLSSDNMSSFSSLSHRRRIGRRHHERQAGASWKDTMFWRRAVTCAVCLVCVPKSQARPTLERGATAVCRTCYERWKRSGRVCARCRRPVNGAQQPGLFPDQCTLGHTECGGMLLAAKTRPTTSPLRFTLGRAMSRLARVFGGVTAARTSRR